jgi:dTDP-4-dehydrorhamnose reductase
VVNAAGYVRVDEAEQDQERCFRENAVGPTLLTEACRARGVRLVTFSSDLVFDGAQDDPYDESALPAPLNVYGASKAEAERRVLTADPSALVIRTSAFFGPHDDFNVVTLALRALADGGEWVAADDLTVSPTYVPDLADAVLDLLIDGESGVWHLANSGVVTWAELARRAARAVGLDPGRVAGVPAASLSLAAARPINAALTSRRGWVMPSLDEALRRYANECGARWMQPVDRGQAKVEGVG